ncbi:MAG: hypothetical protein ACK4TA_12680 [Saprospiraceae bacterium]
MIKIGSGYYLSNPMPYEDWIGGNKIEGVIFSGYFFIDERRVAWILKSFELKNLPETVFFSRDAFMTSNRIGIYKSEGDLLTITLDAESAFVVKEDFKIVSPDVITRNENIYTYKDWD